MSIILEDGCPLCNCDQTTIDEMDELGICLSDLISCECPTPQWQPQWEESQRIQRQMQREAQDCTHLPVWNVQTDYYHHMCGQHSTVVHTVRNMFHMFHGLITLWNIYVEHRFRYNNARLQMVLARMFQCSIKNRPCVRLTVDRCSLLLIFY